MRRTWIILLVVFISTLAAAQGVKPPFWKDIEAFKRQDSIQPPPKNAILFVGSSSFTKWTDVQQYFPGYAILNRGFGGSSLPDLIRYENEVIFKYHPKQIVIYCGENDLAASDTVTGQTVYNRFKQLYTDIRKKYKTVPVAFISLKPSPSRKALFPKMEEANRLIRSYLEGQKHTTFVDVYHSMLDGPGSPMGNLFLGDSLHMTPKGYAIWQKRIQPVLVR